MDEERVIRLIDYLYQRAGQLDISAHMVQDSWDAVLSLRHATGGTLPVPNCGIGGYGQVLFTWNRDEHHFECEVFPGARIEYFYRNRRTGAIWDHESRPGVPISAEIKEKLALFLPQSSE